MPCRRIAAAAALTGVLSVAPAIAAVGDQVIWDLATPLDGAPSASIGSLVLVEYTNFVEFTLTASWSEALFGGSAFISRVLFVYEPAGSASFITDLSPIEPQFSLNPAPNAGYSFGLLAGFPTSAASPGARLGNGDYSIWRITGTTLANFDEPAFSDEAGRPPAFALAQLQGALGDASYKYVAAVPEPGTWALLLAGLAGVAGVARRRLGQSGPGA